MACRVSYSTWMFHLGGNDDSERAGMEEYLNKKHNAAEA